MGRENLEKLLEVKGTLIKKALGIDDLHFEEEEEIIYFPWLQDVVMTSDEAKAYTHFIGALCEMSVKQKRVTAKEKAVDNEKIRIQMFSPAPRLYWQGLQGRTQNPAEELQR